MTDYSALYRRAWDDTVEPQTLPGGHWVLRLLGAYYNVGKEEGQSGRFSFKFAAEKPLGDVDPKGLKALGEGYDFSINDEIYNADAFWHGNRKDDAKVADFFRLFGIGLPKEPLLVPGEDGMPRVNPKLVTELRKGRVQAVLKVEEGRGKNAGKLINTAAEFTAYKDVAKAA